MSYDNENTSENTSDYAIYAIAFFACFRGCFYWSSG